MRRLFLIIVYLTLLLTSSAWGQGVIIVNKNNPINHINCGQLKQIYNGNFKLWDFGKRVVAVDLPDTNPLAVKFARTILGVDVETKRKLWMQKLYAGVGTPPLQREDESSIVTFVASEPGAIGYVRKENLNNSVKVIRWDGKEEF